MYYDTPGHVHGLESGVKIKVDAFYSLTGLQIG